MDLLVVDNLMTSKFNRIEEREAIQNAKRIHDAIDRELYHLESLCVDWSAWDDSYDFMVTRDEGYLESNLGIDTFIDNHVNLIMFIEMDGTVLWKRVVDLESETDIHVAIFDQERYSQNHMLVAHDIEERMAGLLHTERGLCMIAKSPILTSQKEGPAHGTLIMGRYFNNDYQDILCDQTRTRFEIKQGRMNGDANKERKLKRIDSKYMIDRSHPDTLVILSRLPSLNGVEYYIESTIDRDFMKEGKRTVLILYISLMVVGSVILLVMLGGIQFMVIRPIKKVKEHALEIAGNQVLEQRLYPKRKDEIGILAHEFDMIFENLLETRSRLLESSYKSGLAEMASNFLHNLRNSLTPLMGEIQGIRFACRNVDFQKYYKAHIELDSDTSDPERQKKIREYLLLLDRQNMDYVEEIRALFNTLDDYRHNIEKLLDTQSRWTSAKPVVETLKLNEIGKEIHAFISPSVIRHMNITVHNEDIGLETVQTYRVTFLMILSRLLEFIHENQTDEGGARVVILIKRTEIDEKPYISFRIVLPGSTNLVNKMSSVFAIDNAKGMKPLHGDLIWCSNTASVIGARLEAVESDGSVKSHFQLTIPIIEETSDK